MRTTITLAALATLLLGCTTTTTRPGPPSTAGPDPYVPTTTIVYVPNPMPLWIQ